MAHTLYLVSAEVDGVAYWKFGITRHADPLKRDRKRYKEVFRAVQFEDLLWDKSAIEESLRSFSYLYEYGGRKKPMPGDVRFTAKENAANCEYCLCRAIRRLKYTIGNEWIDGRASLEHVCDFFDHAVARWMKPAHQNDDFFDSFMPQQQKKVEAIRDDIAEAAFMAPATLAPMWA